MQSILPGWPLQGLHSISHGCFEGQLVIAYLSGASLVILNGPQSVLQIVPFDDLLSVVQYNGLTGQIAVATKDRIFVLGIRQVIKGTLSWNRELSIDVAQELGENRTLSWGTEGELLVGTSRNLALYSTHLPSQASSPITTLPIANNVTPLWTRSVPSSLLFANLSPSANLVASVSEHDNLVKIWRRLSFESSKFDHAYLRHPQTVTHLQWRSAQQEGSSDEDVLFTICADGIFRVWQSINHHTTEIMSLFANINMMTAIQPRNPIDSMASAARFAFVIDSSTVQSLASQDQRDPSRVQSKHAQEYLKEVASGKPDIVVIADENGHMSAWGLESVGCKRRSIDSIPKVQPFHINHQENVYFGINKSHTNVLMHALVPAKAPGEIAILSHHFDGKITWHQARLQDLLDPASKQQSLQKIQSWTGHQSKVKKVIRTASGHALVSRTEDNEAIVWKQSATGSIARRSLVDIREHIHRVVLFENGDFLVCLHHDKVTLWDCRDLNAQNVATCEYTLEGKPLCLLRLPEIHESNKIHIASVDSAMAGLVWEIVVPRSNKDSPTMREYCDFQLHVMDQALYMLPVDPAGSVAVVSDFLDIFAHDVAMSYSASGSLRTYTARIDEANQRVDFLTTSTIETGVVNPSLGSATSIRRAALVDETKRHFTIWDTRSGRLDHDETFEQHINDLDWAATPDGQSILAVGFSRHVQVYTQLRYDYVNDLPAWACIKSVHIPSYCPTSIGDSVWLGDGSLVIGTGNQLLVSSKTIDLSKDVSADLQSSIPHHRLTNVYDVVRRLNGPLPVFHPQFISQCILAGKVQIVLTILTKFLTILRFYSDGEELDPLLGLETDDFVFLGEHHPSDNSSLVNNQITEDISKELADLLTQKSIPQLTSSEQFSLVWTIDSVATVSMNARSIDTNACRFLLFWRAQLLHSHGRPTAASSSSNGISWREACFAYHSISQDILTSLILSTSHKQLTWPLARASKLFSWLTSRETLLQQFENLARNAYTATDPRDPVECSLYYLALRKKQILVGLWRMATGSREQAATMKLLRNDFSEPRWKIAAKKNAFALMGRRRFAYAAAFFLLADDLRSALGVLANQMEEIDLAIAVGRVYGGDDCEPVKELILNRVLKTAVRRGDRWMATWGFWFIGQRSNAVRALVSPLADLIIPEDDGRDTLEHEVATSLRAKSFVNDDPALIVLYEQLRSKSMQTLQGALMIKGEEETRFVIRTAGLLRRMGCDMLALDLVRNWEFLRVEHGKYAVEEEPADRVAELPPSPSLSREFDPRRLLRRRSSQVVDDRPEAVGMPIRPKIASMLDGFGFNDHEETRPSQPRSLLDDFAMDGPHSSGQLKPQTTQPRSLLDDFAFDAPKSSTNQTIESPPSSSGANAWTGEAPTDGWTAKTEEKKTVFKEPDARSILDSFGF